MCLLVLYKLLNVSEKNLGPSGPSEGLDANSVHRFNLAKLDKSELHPWGTPPVIENLRSQLPASD
jgi:hypothetical protein